MQLRLLRQKRRSDGSRLAPNPPGTAYQVPDEVDLLEARDWVSEGSAEWLPQDTPPLPGTGHQFVEVEKTDALPPTERTARDERRAKWLEQIEADEVDDIEAEELEAEADEDEWTLNRYTPERYLEKWPTGPHADKARRILGVE